MLFQILAPINFRNLCVCLTFKNEIYFVEEICVLRICEVLAKGGAGLTFGNILGHFSLAVALIIKLGIV